MTKNRLGGQNESAIYQRYSAVLLRQTFAVNRTTQGAQSPYTHNLRHFADAHPLALSTFGESTILRPGTA